MKSHSTVYRTSGRAVLLVVLTLLSGCGFSLRNSDVLLTRFSDLQLNLQQPGSELSQQLRQALRTAGVSLIEPGFDSLPVPVTTDGAPVLSVSDEQVLTRPVTVDPRARAAQYELRLSVQFSLASSQQVVIPPELLVVERLHFENIETINGSQEEIRVLQEEMRRDLINQILRRLESAPSAAF